MPLGAGDADDAVVAVMPHGACGAGSDFTANHKARINMIEFDVIGHTGEDDYTAVELRYKREAFIELLDPCNLSRAWQLKTPFHELAEFQVGKYKSIITNNSNNRVYK